MPETAEISGARGSKVSGSDVKDDMASLRGDVEKLIDDVASLARQRVGDGKDTLDETITELTERARDYVRDNPLGACATAAAAGFALALLMKR